MEAAYALFADDVETGWPEAVTEAARLAEVAGDWRSKPDDWYREAAHNPEIPIAEPLADLLDRVRRLQ